MKLLLRRTQRTGGMLGGKVLFALDAGAELTPEEKSLVQKYTLGKTVVYDSETRKKHAAAADAHFDEAANTAGYTLASTGAGLWRNARGLARVAMAALSLPVTIDGLTNGQHIECKDLDELLGAEGAMREACQNVKAYLETALPPMLANMRAASFSFITG